MPAGFRLFNRFAKQLSKYAFESLNAVGLQQRNISPVQDRVELIGPLGRQNHWHVRYSLAGESGQREPILAG